MLPVTVNYAKMVSGDNVNTYTHIHTAPRKDQRWTEVNETSKHSHNLQAIPKCSLRRKKQNSDSLFFSSKQHNEYLEDSLLSKYLKFNATFHPVSL